VLYFSKKTFEVPDEVVGTGLDGDPRLRAVRVVVA
jgi:hypothetical protein